MYFWLRQNSLLHRVYTCTCVELFLDLWMSERVNLMSVSGSDVISWCLSSDYWLYSNVWPKNEAKYLVCWHSFSWILIVDCPLIKLHIAALLVKTNWAVDHTVSPRGPFSSCWGAFSHITWSFSAIGADLLLTPPADEDHVDLKGRFCQLKNELNIITTTFFDTSSL